LSVLLSLSRYSNSYDIDVYREVEEEDVDLNEFKDEIDAWIIDALKAVASSTGGCSDRPCRWPATPDRV